MDWTLWNAESTGNSCEFPASLGHTSDLFYYAFEFDSTQLCQYFKRHWKSEYYFEF